MRNQLSRFCKTVALDTGHKASQLYNVSKLNLQIMDLKSQVKEALAEAGAMVYATHSGQPTEGDLLVEKLEEIDGYQEKIQMLEDQILALKAKAVCTTCGALSMEDGLYCGNCGAKL